MTPTIYRVIVKNIYIFNNTNNISFFLFTSHLYINAVFWEIWSTFVPIYCKIPQTTPLACMWNITFLWKNPLNYDLI